MKKVAIVGVEGSGKTVLMAAMGDKYRKPGEDGLFLYANSRKTIEYCNEQINMLRNQHKWPDSTPPDSLVNLEWTLMRRKKGGKPEELCSVAFLDFAGEIYRYAFADSEDDADKRNSYKNQIEAIKSHLSEAESAMVLVNLGDIINSRGVTKKASEMDWLSQRIFDFIFSEAPEKRVAIVFTQKDLYNETIVECGGLQDVFEEYLPSVFYGHESQIVPFAVSAVNKTTPDDKGCQIPASDFDSEGFEELLSWMADDDAYDLIRDKYTRYEEAEDDDVAEWGDFVKIDYTGIVDDKSIHVTTPEAQNIMAGRGLWIQLEDGHFLPEVLLVVKGMKVGETKSDVKVKFDQYAVPDSLKGKNAIYTITLVALRRRVLPTDTEAAELVKSESKNTVNKLGSQHDIRYGVFYRLGRCSNLLNRLFLCGLIAGSSLLGWAFGWEPIYWEYFYLFSEVEKCRKCAWETLDALNGNDIEKFKVFVEMPQGIENWVGVDKTNCAQDFTKKRAEFWDVCKGMTRHNGRWSHYSYYTHPDRDKIASCFTCSLYGKRTSVFSFRGLSKGMSSYSDNDLLIALCVRKQDNQNKTVWFEFNKFDFNKEVRSK